MLSINQYGKGGVRRPDHVRGRPESLRQVGSPVIMDRTGICYTSTDGSGPAMKTSRAPLPYSSIRHAPGRACTGRLPDDLYLLITIFSVRTLPVLVCSRR